MAIYIDTSAWIALLDRKDEHHEAAVATKSQIQTDQESLITGWHTLVEFTDGLSQHAGQRTAAETVSRILKSPSVTVEPSEPHQERALELFTTRTDWKVDLSDCLSFALMESHGIHKAFSYDRDFEKAGFPRIG